MQRSFSIVDDDNVSINEENSKIEDISDKDSLSPERTVDLNKSEEQKPSTSVLKLSASPIISGRKTVVRNRSPLKDKLQHLSSGSESELSENDEEKQDNKMPGEYDPSLYENLQVDDEIKDLFQYIVKYIPQQLNLDYKFKPFIPEFLPAVGDIDAFLKIVPPEHTISGDIFNPNQTNLGLHVLDEPSTNQSDPALLHLQLRASSVNPTHKNTSIVTKSVDNVERNVKIIDKWIKDISDLHKSKSSPIVRYSQPMPDLDDLMQEWPEEMENYIKTNGFPKFDDKTDLSEYINTVCNLFHIPVVKSRIQMLHLLFCLYAAIKSTQLYQSNQEKNHANMHIIKKNEEADQLVLD